MVLFQSSFVNFCSTHGSDWSAIGKETNSSLHNFIEKTIFDFLLTLFYFIFL